MILNNNIYLFVIHGTFGGHFGGLGVVGGLQKSLSNKN